MTRNEMIEALAEWGIPAENMALLSDAALKAMYDRYMPPVTDEQLKQAFGAMLPKEKEDADLHSLLQR